MNFYEKLKEAYKVSEKIGHLPERKKAESDGYTFSTGGLIGNWIAYQKTKLNKNEMAEEEKKYFLEYLNYYSTFNVKCREIEKVAQELNRLPVIDKNESNSKYIRKFYDGTDMGSWIVEYERKLKRGLLEEEKANRIEYLVKNYSLFSIKLKQAIQFSKELGELPTIDRINSNKQKTRKFTDGSDVGSWISVKLQEVRNNKLSKENKEAFCKFYQQYCKLTYEEKIREAIEISIELEYYPTPYRKDRSNQKLILFSDSSNVGAFIANCKTKYKQKKMTTEEMELFYQLLNISFPEIKLWNQYYRELVKYVNLYSNLDIDLSYQTENQLYLGEFIKKETEKFYLPEKGIIQQIHEDKLKKLDSNWMTYYNENLSSNHNLIK